MRPELLVAANRAALHGTLARWLMHDLRGPAQALSLVSDLLESGDGMDEPAVRLSVQEASARLRELLDLLDHVLRRPDPDDSSRPVLLGDAVAVACRLMRLQRTAIALHADPELAARLPPVRGTDEHVRHALLAVLMNAYEALGSRAGGVVRVVAEADGATVRMLVEDNGPGLSPEIVPRLFEPFATTQVGRPLAGLGLYAARTLLGRHGGTVRPEPRESGACFVLELPVWSAPAKGGGPAPR